MYYKSHLKWIWNEFELKDIEMKWNNALNLLNKPQSNQLIKRKKIKTNIYLNQRMAYQDAYVGLKF